MIIGALALVYTLHVQWPLTWPSGSILGMISEAICRTYIELISVDGGYAQGVFALYSCVVRRLLRSLSDYGKTVDRDSV